MSEKPQGLEPLVIVDNFGQKFFGVSLKDFGNDRDYLKDDIPDFLNHRQFMDTLIDVRVLLGASEYQGQQIIQLAKRLYQLETDSLRQIEAKYMQSLPCRHIGIHP